MDSYNRKTDEELLRRMHNGDKKVIDYLMVKYKNLVRKKAKALFLIGADNDDLIQEGMIGLFKDTGLSGGERFLLLSLCGNLYQ